MDCLEICVIASPGEKGIAVLARCGPNTVVDSLPATEITALSGFPARLARAILGQDALPSQAEMQAFGRKLFDTLAQPQLQAIFHALPAVPLSYTLLSNRPEFQALPWEFITEPNRPFGPSIVRSVVRLVPTMGIQAFLPGPIGDPPRVLFVSADPIGPGPVDWPDVKAAIERAFEAEMPAGFVLDVIEGATRKGLATHIANAPAYDIVHFSCHGRVVNGMGEILLVDPRTKEESPLTSRQLSNLLQGRGVRLVVLSACQTAAGNFVASDFSVMADALVRSGVPAVVGNQFPVFNNTVATFVNALYHELLQSGNIDLAVAEGRVALHAAFHSTSSDVEWGIPTLYRHATAAQLFIR